MQLILETKADPGWNEFIDLGYELRAFSQVSFWNIDHIEGFQEILFFRNLPFQGIL